MGMVTISFETGGRKGFEPINDSRPSLCATPAKEVGERRRKLITADKSTIVPEPFLDTAVVENGQGDSRFPDPPCAD